MFIHQKWNIEFILDEFITCAVVYVAMRVEQQNRLQFPGSDIGNQFIFFIRRITARVNNNTLSGFIKKNVCVFLKRIECE